MAPAGAEPVAGGLGALGWDFAAAARGAELRLGREASEVTLVRGRRVTGLVFGAGSRPMR
jgi:hypothetical protein